MFVVGLTGGIGSGKSTVCLMLQRLGAIVIDADVVAREVVEPGKPAWRNIRKHFGPGVFRVDGTLNRELLGLIIFGDEKQRRRLNSITHWRICRAIIYRLIVHMFNGEQFVVVDLPLLFESGMMTSFLRSVIVVSCTAAEQVERVCARDGLSKDLAEDRINAQIPLNVKRLRADYVIDNSGDGRTVKDQVSNVYMQLRSSWGHWKFRLTMAYFVFSFIAIPVMFYILVTTEQ